MLKKFGVLAVMGLLIGCGDDVKKKPSGTNITINSTNSTNASNNTNGVSNSQNSIDPELCGNGALDPNELCDPAIASGEGSCPTSCNELECASNVLVGDAASCTARCEASPVACQNDDGCCPAGCDANNDNDCTNVCGDGTVEGNEICDGNCPMSCDDGNVCTTDALVGSSMSCNAECSFSTITSCSNGDGCCPPGCSAQTDNDCTCNPTTTCAAEGAECGTIDDGCQTISCGSCGGGESCDTGTNTCVVNTDIGNACFDDSDCSTNVCLTAPLFGWQGGYCSQSCSSDSQCGDGAHCGYRNQDGNGVCLRDCTSDAACGRADYECFDADGAGVNECAAVGNGSATVGDECDVVGDCSGGQDAMCVMQDYDFNGGYCASFCSSNSDCPSGSHCSVDFGVCLDSCSTDSDCRNTGYLCMDIDEDFTTECYTAATGILPPGSPCNGDWECMGDENGWCVPPDQGFPGGYCMSTCGPETAGCPSGSTCVSTGDGDFCLESCTSDTSCSRTGYTCQDIDSDGQVESCMP